MVGTKRTEAFEGVVNLVPEIISRDADVAPWDGRYLGEGHSGRPKLDQEKLRAVLTLVRNGMSLAKAARHVGLGRSTLYRELAIIPSALPGAA